MTESVAIGLGLNASCDPLTLDASATFNSGGRDWQSVSWTLTQAKVCSEACTADECDSSICFLSLSSALQSEVSEALVEFTDQVRVDNQAATTCRSLASTARPVLNSTHVPSKSHDMVSPRLRCFRATKPDLGSRVFGFAVVRLSGAADPSVGLEQQRRALL